MSIAVLAVVASAASLVAGLVAAAYKASLLTRQNKEKSMKSVTIKIGDETINLEAPEADARAAVQDLQRRAGTRAVARQTSTSA